MSNTYNLAWKKHPNLSWQNQNNTLNPITSNQQEYQNQPRQNLPQNLPHHEYHQPNNYKTLENTLTQFMTQTSAYMARTNQFNQKTYAFMDRTEMRMQNQEATLKSLENQVGQISQVLNTRPMRGFPSDTKVDKGATHEQCKAITKRTGQNLNTPPKSIQGEEIVAKPNATTVPDNPATIDTYTSTGKDHEIPTESKEAYPTTTTTPHIRLPRADTLRILGHPHHFLRG
ncbi:hypothetical protein GQ457_05G023840 [Hibiscus cannabinus]